METKMKYFICLLMALISMHSFAQTQQGYVKTKGRLANNGTVIAGTRLPGATVTIRGGNAAVSGNKGTFTLSIPGDNYYLQNVEKNGYVLTDPDVLAKQYAYSKNPLVLVLEDKEQQKADMRAIERKISSNFYSQLQKRSDELEALKEKNQITEEKYRELLQKLNHDQKDNEKLICEMADRYSKMDFDEVDEFNRRISCLILEGKLTEADSLLNTKGNINSRATSLRQHQEANAQAEKELQKKQKKLEKSKELVQKELENLAQDCYRKHEIFKMQYQNDSVTYYLELRAELDTMNASWQFDAAYSGQHSGSASIQKYYNRVLSLTQNNLMGYNLYLYSTAANNLGAYYAAIKDYQSAGKYYEIGILGRNAYAEQSSNPNDWNHVAWSLVSLSDLYISMKCFKESEDCLKKASDIYERIRPTYYEGNIYSYGRLYDKLGWFYLQSANFELSDSNYTKAWNYYKIANKKDPNPFKYYSLVEMKKELIWGITDLYKKLHRENEIESLYLELKGLYEKNMPCGLKEIELEYTILISKLALMYSNNQRFKETEPLYEQTLAILRRLAKDNPQTYDTFLAQTLGNLSFNALFMQKNSQAEQYAREGLSIDSTQHWICANLAHALLFQGKYNEAERIYHQYKDELKDSFLDDFKQFAEAGVIPKEREADVEKIKKILMSE